MKKRAILGLFFVLALFTGLSTLYAEKVNYVVDGDTFILENNQRVRMIGINAPEIAHKKYGKMTGQAFGKEAKEHLSDFINKKDVTLKSGAEEYDRFGRRLAYVYLPDGTFVNRKMIEDGFAETFRKFPFEFKAEFLKLEDQAREAKRGMWSESNVKPSPDSLVDSLVKLLEKWKIL